METKRCNICARAKDIESFRRLTGLKNKFNKSCKECIDKTKKRQEQKKEFLQNYQKEYYSANREYYREYRRKWGQENKDLLSEWSSKKYAEDKEFKNIVITRSTLRNLIQKGFEFEATLGCSFVEFKQHMESKFQPGMTWDNYGREKGQWSIDHIDCLSKTQLSNPNHYTNLQPMWTEENSKKRDK